MFKLLISSPTFDNNPESFVFYAFCWLVFVQLLYVILIYSRMACFRSKKKQENKELPALSIVIVAHNQCGDLSELLPILLTQNYPLFEVIVVSNQSEDDTHYLLADYQKHYENLKFTIVEPSRNLKLDKKLPLTLAMKLSAYEHILLVDTDCRINSLNYLREIGSRYALTKTVVLGYAPAQKSTALLNRLISKETAWMTVNYMSYALAKLPYLGNGRNMSFTKRILSQEHEHAKNYISPHQHSDIFVNQLTQGKAYTIATSPDSYVYFVPRTTWNGWIYEKYNYFLTLSQVSWWKRLCLAIYPCSLALMYLFFIILISKSDFNTLSLCIFAFIFCVKWCIQGACFFKLQEKMEGICFPFYDLLFSVLLPIIYMTCDTKQRNR